ncbi:unnamed protein product [Closterium sp. NIES-53]
MSLTLVTRLSDSLASVRDHFLSFCPTKLTLDLLEERIAAAEKSILAVAASSQVFAATSRSSPASAPCSCRPLSHETLLWHHRLGHPSLPRLRGMASCTLISGLPRSLPPLPPGPAPTCVPCVEGRQRATPHSSTFPTTEAPLQTLHMDVWGPARVRGQGHERYFLLVIDDYSRYTTVFPLHSKGEVPEVFIDWIRGARRQLSERFGSDLPVLRLHSDRGGEFSSDLLRAFCRAEGIRQTFTLSASPQKNGIAEHRIGMVMDVARTSMIHAAAPHFLWPFAVQYTAHQINLQPCVSLPETTPTLRWTGKVGDASAFRVWGSRAFVRDTSANKLSSHAIPCVFLGFPPDASRWQFYHPTSRRVVTSQDVTFDDSLSYYRLFPYRTASLPPLPLFLAPGTPPIDPLPPHGPAPSGVSQVDPAEPVEVAVDSGARGAEPAGVGTGGAEPRDAEPERVESGGSEPERVEPGGTASGGAEPTRVESGGSSGVPLRPEPLSPQRLREWYARRCRRATGAAGGAAGTSATGGAAGAGAAGGVAGAGATGGAAGARAAGGAAGAGAAGAAGPGGARTGDTGAAGAGGAAGVVTGETGAEGTGAVSAVLGLPPSPGPTPPLLSPPPVQSQSPLLPSSPLHGPSPYSGPTRGLTERREPESRPVSPVSRSASPVRTARTGRRVLRPRPPPVPGTHSMTLSPSTDPQRLVDISAACCLDYATILVAESASVSVCPPSVGGECALGTDVLEDRQEEFECFAAAGPYSSQLQAAMDAEMASWNSTGTYVDEVPPPGANIVCGMWIFRVKRPPGSPPVFKARYVARGFSQRQGVDFFQTFSPTPKMTTLRVLLHVAAHRDYELHSLDFSTAFLQGSLHEEIWLRRPPGFTGSFPAGTQWSLRRPVYVLVYVDDLVFATADTEALAHVKSELQKRHTCTDLVLQRFGFTYSSPQSTPLPTGHSLLAPPSDESVEPSGPYPELVGCLMYLMTCTRPDFAYPLSLLARYLCSTLGMGLVLGGRARVVLTGYADASWVDDLATQRSSQGYTFTLGSGSVSWRSTCSSSVFSSSYEAEIYAWAMAAQELHWLTYLLTDLGEAPRSPPVLYVNSKAMLALCEEHRLEHRTKHIALHYFLARELQQRGQLRLAYVASQANTADVFTKALQPCDHQPCFPFLDWSCDLLFSPTLPMGENLQWIAKLESAAVSMRRMSRNTAISRKSLSEWNSRKGELEGAHRARKRLHGRGRESWYRDMEIEVYSRVLAHRKRCLAVSVGRLKKWSHDVMKILHPEESDVVKAKFRELNIVPAVIPAGCTSEIQPLDVAVNRSFKAAVRQLYQEWFESEGVDCLTERGNICKPPPELTLKTISACSIGGTPSRVCNNDEIDDEIAADGFCCNNVEEPESDGETDQDGSATVDGGA